MTAQVEVHGSVAQGFEHVRDVFVDNYTLRDELGSAVAAWVRGTKVVDLWAGPADTEADAPWAEDTMAVMFSATKGLVATAFLMLEDRGELDVDKPVAWYWPEFGRAGKADITVRTLLNHRSGLSVVDQPLTLRDFEDFARVEAALVRQRPTWAPGSRQAYGATSFGMYTQALFRRITGETLGPWLQREVFEPLGGDLYLGLPAAEESRVATLYPVPAGELLRKAVPEILRGGTTEARVYKDVLLDRSSIARRALGNPSFGPKRLAAMNERWVRELELPWMNAIGTARAVAKVYATLATGELDGVRLVSDAAPARIAGRQSWTYDDGTLRKPMGYSQGFIKEEPHLLSPNEAHFGHTGAGGTVGFADPTHQLGFSYLMNRMDHRVRSPRCIALCRAMYACLQPV